MTRVARKEKAVLNRPIEALNEEWGPSLVRQLRQMKVRDPGASLWLHDTPRRLDHTVKPVNVTTMRHLIWLMVLDPPGLSPEIKDKLKELHKDLSKEVGIEPVTSRVWKGYESSWS